jgi:hypothetical protein
MFSIMKKTLFCLVLVASFSRLKAQMSLDIDAGLHVASVTPNFLNYPDTVKKTSATKIGIEVGFTINFPIKKNFSIRSGILYSSKGSGWTQVYDTTNLIANTINLPSDKKNKVYSSSTELSINYIDIPINFEYRLKIGGSTYFFVGGGPKFSLLFTGSKTVNTLSFSQEKGGDLKSQYMSNVNNDLPIGKLPGRYRILHLSSNLLGGIDFGRVSLSAVYARDISSFYEEKGRNYKHTTVGLTLGTYIGKI